MNFILLCASVSLWLLTAFPASAATQVTGTYDLGQNPRVMTTVGGQPQYGLVFVQRNKPVTYNSVEYGTGVIYGYLDVNGQLNDGAGNLYLDLIPNLGATPADGYYVVTVNIQGQVHAEIWAVPDQPTVDAEVCRQAQPPSSTAPALFYQFLQEDGADLTQRQKLNLTGAGVSCADNAGQGSTDCTFSGGGSVPVASATTSGTVKTDQTVGDPAVYLTTSTDSLLTGKADSVHTHAEADVTNLVADLASKVPTSRSVNTSAPLAGGGPLSADLTLSIPAAGSAQSGYLSSTDWNAFDAKESTLTFNSPLSRSVDTISCPTCEVTGNRNAASGYAGLTAATKLNPAQGQEVWSSADLTDFADKSGSGTTILGASVTTPADNQVLTYSSGDWINQAQLVTSVFGRTGAVTAQSGDYSASQVTNAAARNAANVFTAAGGLTMDNQLGLRLREGDAGGDNYIEHRAPATITTDLTLTWNVTGQCTGSNAGKLTINASNEIVCGDDISGGAGGGYDSVAADTGTASKTSTESLKFAGTSGEISTAVTTDDATQDVITWSLPATLSTPKTVSGDWDFTNTGSSYVGASFTSAAADPADAGILRCGNNEACVAWELATPGVDKALIVDASDILQFNGTLNATTLTEGGSAVELDTHASEHQHSGGDEVATATPGADAIPKAEADGDLNAGWIGQDQAYAWTSTSNTYVGASYTSAAADPADGQPVRLGNTEGVAWELATPGADRVLSVTANDRLAFNGLDCSTGDQYITANVSGEFICGTDNDSGGSPAWEALVNTADTATSYTSDNVAETLTFTAQAAYTTENFFTVQSNTGNPTGGTLGRFIGHDADLNTFRVNSSAEPADDKYIFHSGPDVSSLDAGFVNFFNGASNIFATLDGTNAWPTLSYFEDSDGTNDVYGLRGVANARHTAGTRAAVFGVEAEAYLETAGTVTDLAGVAGFAEMDGTSGTVTRMSALFAYTNARTAGTVDENYGLYVQDQSGVGTNNWAVYTAGTALSHFGGAVNAVSGFRVNGAATTDRYLKGDGTNFIVSSGSASGVGSCTDQVVTATNSDAAPTCANVSSAMITDGVVSPSDATSALRQEMASINIFDPTTSDTNLIQHKFANAVTIQRVSCSTDTGTATIQLDERAEGTPNTAGTDVMTSTLVCDNDTQATTSFTNAGIAADAPLNLQITATASTPGVVRVHIDYQVD